MAGKRVGDPGSEVQIAGAQHTVYHAVFAEIRVMIAA